MTEISYGDAPLGETGGLHYVHWDFGVSYFKSLKITVNIYNEPNFRDGLYFQMFQGEINGVGFYFGIQTDVCKENVGVGKGLIFSRWNTDDLSNVKRAKNAWTERGHEDGKFISIRKKYDWTTHVYQLKIAYIETDDYGDWYGVWILDLDDGREDFLGSIRFPKIEPERSGIKDHGACARSTWIELYHKRDSRTPIPTWHVSVKDIYVDNGIRPRHAKSQYSSKIGRTDIHRDKATGEIHLLMGHNVTRKHDAGKLY